MASTPGTTRTKTTAKDKASTKLDARVFGVIPTDHTLLHQAYVAYLDNGRENLATTKTRADVRGGGRKPWRQKGTGRARVGSSRVPHWRGGGVSLGPTGNENYSKHLNVKAKRLALRQALSLAAQDSNVKVIDNFDAKDGKVSKSVAQLAKAGAVGKVLLVITEKNDLVDRATRNIPAVKAVAANYLNVYDIMNADSIVLVQSALDVIVDWLGKETK
jgi:large subunit ribosomal protein L4